MAKITELSDGGSLQSTDFLIAVRSGGNVKVQADGNLSLGTVTADGLTVDDADPQITLNESDTTDLNTNFRNGLGTFAIRTANDAGSSFTNRLKVDHSTGDISFYEDTGNTAKFFWDAGEETLAIGASSATRVSTSYGQITLNGASGGILNFTDDGVEGVRLQSVVDDLFIQALGDTIFRNGGFTGGNEAMRIDSSGNVGIGSSTPTFSTGSGLEIQRTSATATLRLEYTGANGYEISAEQTQVTYNSVSSLPHVFEIGSSPKMTLDASGNLLVGRTSSFSSSRTEIQSSGSGGTGASECLSLNNTGADGSMLEFYKAGVSVGNIGTSSDIMYIGSSEVNLLFGGDFAIPAIAPCDSAGAARDNAIDLGFATSGRFNDAYITNGVTTGSDANDKQDIETLSDAEQRVAVACKGLLRKWRWKDAVEAKGDEARIHFGIIAQDLQAAFEAEGLDAGRYAMFMSNTWTDEETGEERTRLGVRYHELLAFIIAAI